MPQSGTDSTLQQSLPGLGLALGAGAGLTIGLAIAGGPGIALGAIALGAIGAGVGLVSGAIARNQTIRQPTLTRRD